MQNTLSPYLFLELALLVFLVGYCWEYFALRDFGRRSFWFAAAGLAVVWFLLDQAAIALGIWTFPANGSFPFRLFSLPLEEYLLFFLHTFICAILLRHCSGQRQ